MEKAGVLQRKELSETVKQPCLSNRGIVEAATQGVPQCEPDLYWSDPALMTKPTRGARVGNNMKPRCHRGVELSDLVMPMLILSESSIQALWPVFSNKPACDGVSVLVARAYDAASSACQPWQSQ